MAARHLPILIVSLDNITLPRKDYAMSSISSVSSSAANYQAMQAAASAAKPVVKTPVSSVPAAQSVKTNDGDDAGGIDITA